MERSERVERFRERLAEVIERTGLSRSAFAARIGLDRSTLSQLLAPGNDRLPRAETVAAIAEEAQVSADWLLGLSQEHGPEAELVERALEVEPGAGLPMDERLQRWHAEAAGAKIRYVPTTLPDLLKTEEIVTYEYSAYAEEVPRARIRQAGERLAALQRPETDMEACGACQMLESFARGEGVWRRLDREARRRQLEQMIALTEELYPNFRWFLYDGLTRFSVPFTVFGSQRVAVYFGNQYFVFNATEHIRIMMRHFDDLIRAAVVQPNEVPGFLKNLRTEIGTG
jgi:transcriptional regulator with XRE-family HTH domain